MTKASICDEFPKSLYFIDLHGYICVHGVVSVKWMLSIYFLPFPTMNRHINPWNNTSIHFQRKFNHFSPKEGV